MPGPGHGVNRKERKKVKENKKITFQKYIRSKRKERK
jgi:hypothetical protein